MSGSIASYDEMLHELGDENRKLNRQLSELDLQSKVREFQIKFGFTCNDSPTFFDDDLQIERLGWLLEEIGEYAQALAVKDILKVADALADILYILYGTCVTHGIDIAPVFLEIHRSNMTKSKPSGRVGKAIKGLDYSKPDVERVLWASRKQ